MDDRIAEEITRIMIEEAREKSAEQMSSIKNSMYTAYELSWADEPKAEKAIVHEQQQQMQVPVRYEQETDEESTEDEEETDSEGGDDEEHRIMIVGSYGEDGEHYDDGRCERGMDRSGDYRCECKWEVTSTVIVQGVDELRAVEETEWTCFGCAEDGCRCKSCELGADEERYEDEMGCGGGNPWAAKGESARPEYGTWPEGDGNDEGKESCWNETAASPAALRTQQENLGRRRAEAEIDFEEPRRGGPGYRSLDEESMDQGGKTSRTDQESLTRRGDIDAYLKRIQ